VRPLVLHDPVAQALFWPSVILWGAGEIQLQLRTISRGQGEGDRSRRFLFSAVVIGVTAGFLLAGNAGTLLPGGGWWPVIAGLVVLWTGIAIRAWAIRTLGRYFSCAVIVHEDQPVIDTGPYRRIRHPSYTGLLLVVLGIGIALDNALSVAACVLPTLAAFSVRLLSEEQTLARELGEPYREYMKRTDRLIPGVW
jgi:protein-S-isoprenylcysteine O-methyltransferase Ste14